MKNRKYPVGYIKYISRYGCYRKTEGVTRDCYSFLPTLGFTLAGSLLLLYFLKCALVLILGK